MRMFIEFSRSEEVSRLDLLGDRGHIRIVAAGGKLTEPRLHRHQLSHQIDKLVQLGSRHAQTGRRLGFVIGAAAA